MYAQRFQPSHGSRPFSAGAALAINAAIFGALIFAVPNFVPKPADPPMTPIDVLPPIDPPPVEPVQPKEKTKAETPIEKIFTPPTANPTHNDKPLDTTIYDPPAPPLGPVVGSGSEFAKPAEPPAPLPLIGASADPRYARDLQPAYPAGRLREGREGIAVVRVLIGVDGRVKDIQLVRTDADEFFQATRKQALGRWRFKPATRGGVPEESWLTRTVRFTINE